MVTQNIRMAKAKKPENSLYWGEQSPKPTWVHLLDTLYMQIFIVSQQLLRSGYI